MDSSAPKRTLIFNGTGVNYSWHFPNMVNLDLKNTDKYENIYLISGANTSFSVFWAKQHNVLTWKTEDFLRWNEHTSRVYGNNPITGLLRMGRMLTGVKLPIISEEMYWKAYAMAVKPEFFDLPLSKLPANVKIPLHNLSTGKIEIVDANSHLADFPAYKIFFAATAIPKIFSNINIGGTNYGDPMYAKGFIKWLKDLEQKTGSFTNYNLFKNASYPNGRYECIAKIKNPKKQVIRDNMKFLFGIPIKSYPENVRKSNLQN